MMLRRRLRRLGEKMLGCQIMASSTHGLDVFYDIKRYVSNYRILTIFDVGANIGQSARKFVCEFPEANVYCFEPISSVFKELLGNTRNNRNIQCFPLALGSSKSQVRIKLQKVSLENSLLDKVEEPTDDSNNEDVETVNVDTLWNFCCDYKVGHIDFLKVDAEGYDLEVLKGAEQLLKSRRISFIQVEARMNPLVEKLIPLREFSDYLTERGYALFGIYEQTLEWTGEARLRFSNPVFVSEDTIEKFMKDSSGL